MEANCSPFTHSRYNHYRIGVCLSDSRWGLKFRDVISALSYYGLQHVIHILDDFFIAEATKVDCLGSLSTLLKVLMSLRVPTVAAKTLGPSQVLEFTGIVIDSNRMEAQLPEDKLARMKQLLDSFTNRRSARLVRLQSLIGTLQFACKVVVPGRTFLQRIINLTRGVSNRFHHIRLNKEFSRDITMWKAFLTKWNGRSFFLESFVTTSPDLELYTDAASSVGFGGYLNGKWFQGRWPPHLLIDKHKGISIEWQELFLIVITCVLWYPHFCGKRVQFWCDNENVVAIINSGHSKASRVMDFVRFLALISMKYNFLVRAHHVKSHCICPLPFSGPALPGTRSQRRPESLYHPAFLNDPLKDEVLKYANWSLSWNTNRTYTSGKKRFIQFCLMNRLTTPTGDILPASEGTLVYFASFLARTVRKAPLRSTWQRSAI